MINLIKCYRHKKLSDGLVRQIFKQNILVQFEQVGSHIFVIIINYSGLSVLHHCSTLQSLTHDLHGLLSRLCAKYEQAQAQQSKINFHLHKNGVCVSQKQNNRNTSSSSLSAQQKHDILKTGMGIKVAVSRYATREVSLCRCVF